jgi:hypothetical protein
MVRRGSTVRDPSEVGSNKRFAAARRGLTELQSRPGSDLDDPFLRELLAGNAGLEQDV